MSSHSKSHQDYDEQLENQVFTYRTTFQIYSLAFSNSVASKFRVALGSFSDEVNNTIQIIDLAEKQINFSSKYLIDHKYSPTKILFIPQSQVSSL